MESSTIGNVTGDMFVGFFFSQARSGVIELQDGHQWSSSSTSSASSESSVSSSSYSVIPAVKITEVSSCPLDNTEYLSAAGYYYLSDEISQWPYPHKIYKKVDNSRWQLRRFLWDQGPLRYSWALYDLDSGSYLAYCEQDLYGNYYHRYRTNRYICKAESA